MTSFDPFAPSPSAQPRDQPHPLSPSRVAISVKSLVNSPVIDTTPSLRDVKGKGKAVDFDLETNLILEGGSNEENDETDSEREDVEDSDTEDENENEENYEAERLRRIRENQLILAGLGIEGSSSNLGIGSSSLARIRDGKSPPPGQIGNTNPTRRKRGEIPIFDRSGHIISLPPEGQTHKMACIELPSDRRLRKRISDGEYTDCSRWSDGETRRWKYGFGTGPKILPEGEEEEIGGVTKEFRWRRWRGLNKELRREMRQRGELVEMDARPLEAIIPEGVTAYSLIPGETCHQCRRKSDKPKMKCRNINPICRATFCETCCKRYNYFDFDEESRSFICPLCKDCCNCSNCIRKKNLAHLLSANKGKIQRKSLKYTMGVESNREMDVQTWLENAVKDISRAPFDLVRIVDYEKDVISPDLPLEAEEDIGEKIVVEKPKKMRARKRKLGETPGDPSTANPAGDVDKPKPKRGRPRKVVADGSANSPTVKKSGIRKTGGLVIKLKIPKPPAIETTVTKRPPNQNKVKEVDSDGDTVGDWSDGEPDEQGSESPLTTLSSLSSEGPVIPPRLPFPSQPFYASYPRLDPISSSQTGTTVNATEPLRTTPFVNPHSLPPALGQTSPEVDNDSPDRKRRRPPPRANIIRPPRHSSFSTSHSDAPENDEIVVEQQPSNGLMMDGVGIGPRNLTNDTHNQTSATSSHYPPLSHQQQQEQQLSQVQIERVDIGSSALTLSGPTPSQILNEIHNHNSYDWSGHSRYPNNPYQNHPGYQTLYPPSLPLPHSHQPSSTSPAFSTLPLPIDYSSSYQYSSVYPQAINPMRIGLNISSGPPPYSHSPIHRNLELNPDTSIEDHFLVSPQRPKLPYVNGRFDSNIVGPNQEQTLNHLDILSLAAAEARHSPQPPYDSGNK
ncbi:uncharacterized protein I206_100789 [Kwoniella pini CBS 10737]|uniref:Zinc-finger domain-containing protein n=1 Tax=Kwoniella pini CBS 10737 TaxID=1296096 RepID=A0A1B9ICP6_9TREE|nr:uncharacterized protein I206_00538 [Kwoniella pini CBS 10737]OCF53237.1 hypothetical protein I206_00538 [Kwoniella pini CBS 10737]